MTKRQIHWISDITRRFDCNAVKKRMVDNNFKWICLESQTSYVPSVKVIRKTVRNMLKTAIKLNIKKVAGSGLEVNYDLFTYGRGLSVKWDDKQFFK